MAGVRETCFHIAPRTCALIGILLCCAALVPRVSAQAAVEAAGATAVSAGVAVNAKPVQMSEALPSQATQGSRHIIISERGHSVEANRQALEAKAGAEGAKLLLRSTPSRAQVWINNQPVGNTPLLLIVPSGKYTVEMRGTRQETGRQELALLPKETLEVAVKLELHYPSRVATSH
jgi:hypothetical protein